MQQCGKQRESRVYGSLRTTRTLMREGKRARTLAHRVYTAHGGCVLPRSCDRASSTRGVGLDTDTRHP
eukprot:4776522-Pyramimonas_sp.AAC.1